MKKSEMEKEMQSLLQRRGAYLVLPADMTLAEATKMVPSELLQMLVEDRKPEEGWDPEETPLPERLARVIERALAEARKPYPSFKRILAILEERENAPTWTGASEDPAFNVPLPLDPTEEKRELLKEPAPEPFAWSDEEWLFNRVLGAVEALSDTGVKRSERIAKALAILTGREP